jgi:hypothetical protein
MLGADGDAAEVQAPQYLPHAPLMHRYTEPLHDPFAQVEPAPANHAVFREVGTLLDPSLQLRFLISAQQCRTARPGTIREAFQAMLIIANDPVAQRLSLHRLRFGGRLTRMTRQHHRDRQNPARDLCVGFARRRRA